MQSDHACCTIFGKHLASELTVQKRFTRFASGDEELVTSPEETCTGLVQIVPLCSTTCETLLYLSYSPDIPILDYHLLALDNQMCDRDIENGRHFSGLKTKRKFYLYFWTAETSEFFSKPFAIKVEYAKPCFASRNIQVDLDSRDKSPFHLFGVRFSGVEFVLAEAIPRSICHRLCFIFGESTM
jgi:hypothetical protein